jgi:hypothetical protein
LRIVDCTNDMKWWCGLYIVVLVFRCRPLVIRHRLTRRANERGEGKAVSTKILIATYIMVAGDYRVGKVMDDTKKMVCAL